MLRGVTEITSLSEARDDGALWWTMALKLRFQVFRAHSRVLQKRVASQPVTRPASCEPTRDRFCELDELAPLAHARGHARPPRFDSTFI